MRLLLVEDDPMIGQAPSRALGDAGHAADWVRDGEHALQALESESYDAMLLDLGLGRVDGTVVLKAARARDLKLPVIVVTARDQVDAKVGVLDLGADDYLVKPFEIRELLARRPGVILARGDLESRVYGWNPDVESNTIEVLVHGVRRKLGADVIRTVRGAGYMVDRPR